MPTAMAQDAAQGARFSDFELRTIGDTQLRTSDPSLEEPLAPAAGSARIDPDAADPEIEPEEDEEPAPPPELSTFDIFDGPETIRAERQNLPGRPPAAPTGAQAVRSDEGDETELPPSVPFRATGPVRSPTFSPASAEERINRAVTGLRPSFPVAETDPFAPDGIRVGRFLLFPVLEQDVGVSDNLNSDTEETSGVFSQTSLSARLVSDWSRHQAEIAASAIYRRNFGGPIEEDPRLGVDARLRLDIDRDFTGILSAALSFAREDPILANPLLPPSDRPDVLAYSLGAELQRGVGPASFSVSGDVVREERQLDGEFADLSGADDFTTASLGLRAGYEISPALQPFVAASVGRRIFDEDALIGGTDRDSTISGLRGGLAFDFGEKISGEAAIGYAWNTPVEGALPTTGAPTLDMSINWSPRRGTDVLLSAATFFDPDASSLSTSAVYETALALRHRATARTDLTARLSAALRDREGPGASDDTTYAAEAGLTYWLNRGVALTTLARHERLESEISESEYSANSVRVGVRFQR